MTALDRVAELFKAANPWIEAAESPFAASEEVLLEAIDDATRIDLHPYQQLVQTRPGSPRQALPDLYVDHRLGIRFDLVAWGEGMDSKSGQYCFTVEKCVDFHAFDLYGISPRCVDEWVVFGDGRADDMEASVPILPGEFVERPEDVHASEVFVNMVRLYRFKPLAVLLAQWLEPVYVVRPSRGVIVDGELELVFPGRRIGAAVEGCDLVHNVVERGSQAVEELSEPDRDLLGWVCESPDSNFTLPVVININAHLKRLRFKKLIPRARCGYAVNPCPIDAIPAPIKTVSSTRTLKV